MAGLMHLCGLLNNSSVDFLLYSYLFSDLSFLGLSFVNDARQLSLQMLFLRFLILKVYFEPSEALCVSIVEGIEIKHLFML